MSKTSKSDQAAEPSFGPQVIASPQEYVFERRPAVQGPCKVCGTAGATERTDGLCWVCRRLKISAWRDWDSQESSSD